MNRRTFIKAAAATAILPTIPGAKRDDCTAEVFGGFHTSESRDAIWVKKRFSEIRDGDLFRLYDDSTGEQRDLGRADEIAIARGNPYPYDRKGVHSYGIISDAAAGKRFHRHGQLVAVVREKGRLEVRPVIMEQTIGVINIANPRALAKGMG